MHAKNNCQNSPDSGQSGIKNVFKQPNQITSYLNLGLKLKKNGNTYLNDMQYDDAPRWLQPIVS